MRLTLATVLPWIVLSLFAVSCVAETGLACAAVAYTVGSIARGVAGSAVGIACAVFSLLNRRSARFDMWGSAVAVVLAMAAKANAGAMEWLVNARVPDAGARRWIGVGFVVASEAVPLAVVMAVLVAKEVAAMKRRGGDDGNDEKRRLVDPA
mgnify:CR=1 FL=1